ncbi:MAG: DUF4139 domain-containing protein [Bacillota bacterium]
MMKHLLRSAVLSLALAGIVPIPSLAQSTPPPQRNAAPSADVPVKIVVLYSSGVGYFEHLGPVTDNAQTELRFKTAQINDILKSLVLQDTAGGSVRTVVYPSQDPLDKTLKSFQVNLANNPPLAELLTQLRGAQVKLAVGPEPIAGTILGLEKKPKAVGQTAIEVWQLNLLSGGTIRSLNLEEITKLDLEDPQLQAELHKALSALVQSRDQDKKPVTIEFTGQGQRTVRIGYVVETPIWKTSYRLILPTKPEDKAALQGWAIVENQTDNDWNNVQLSLVSGRPISFVQELYQPLYIPRPVVTPELFASLRPQSYDAGMDLARKEPAAPTVNAPMMMRMAPGMMAPGRRDATAGRAGGSLGDYAIAGSAPAAAKEQLAEKPMDVTSSVASIASAAKLGELFQYTVGNVSLPRQRSAMLPILTDPVEIEKLSIYNAAVLPKNPLNGARVKNTTGKHLLAGPITVLEASSYAGDARIDNLPPGQERLLSYGIDLQVLVNSTKTKQEDTIQTAKIIKGTLNIQRKHVFTQDYQLDNKGTTDRTLIIEHPFRQNWKLVQPEKPLETTDALYRFKTTVPAGKSATFTVREETVQGESIAILPADFGTIDFYSKTGEIPKAVREALVKALSLKQEMTDYQRQVQQARQEIQQLSQDESRIRENLKAVPVQSAQHTRLLQRLDEQDKKIDDWDQKARDAQNKFNDSRKSLEDYLNNLNVEG